MTFTTAIQTCFQKYVTFDGRAARSEFWWFVLFQLIVNVVASGVFGSKSIIALIITLALFLPSLAVGVRRLHDIGKSGWWVLIGLVPLLGLLVLLYFYVQDSESGTNAYGPNPKGM
ncbi:MAG: DUF805 domain-containing protein [Paracoccaceae bacterium]